MKQPVFPHGACECGEEEGCQTCTKNPGPAAYKVMRDDGRNLNVCTRCTLSSDRSRRLLATVNDPGDIYMNYDALGGMIIVMDLASARKARRSRRKRK